MKGCGSLAAVALASLALWSGVSWAGEAAVIRQGDIVHVTVDGAPVKLGQKTLTTVSKGTALKALDLQGAWVAVTVEKDGKKFRGWIARNCLSPAGKAPAVTPVTGEPEVGPANSPAAAPTDKDIPFDKMAFTHSCKIKVTEVVRAKNGVEMTLQWTWKPGTPEETGKMDLVAMAVLLRPKHPAEGLTPEMVRQWFHPIVSGPRGVLPFGLSTTTGYDKNTWLNGMMKEPPEGKGMLAIVTLFMGPGVDLAALGQPLDLRRAGKKRVLLPTAELDFHNSTQEWFTIEPGQGLAVGLFEEVTTTRDGKEHRTYRPLSNISTARLAKPPTGDKAPKP